MADRYVQLPNGSYLQWPEGVSAETFKAKATKLMGTQAPEVPTNKVNDSMGKITGISAYHPKTGLAGIEEKLGDWRQRLSEFANKGAGSYKVGNTSDIGDLMASGPMGALRVGKGASEVPQGKIWKGTKDIVGGAAEAGTIPGMLFTPEGVGAAKGLLPSTEKAGQLLESVAQKAGHIPIDVMSPMKAADEIQKMKAAGGQLPSVVRAFYNRVTKDPQPITYAEARRFYENATRLSFDEFNRLNPKAKYLAGKFTKALDEAIHGAAETVGEGNNYDKAMRMYQKASRFKELKEKAGKKAMQGIGAAAGAAATGAGAGAMYKFLQGRK